MMTEILLPNGGVWIYIFIFNRDVVTEHDTLVPNM